MYKIYITYNKKGFGPYQKVFNTQSEAMDWVRNTDIEITKIDML